MKQYEKYLQVPPFFYDVVENEAKKEIKVFYFEPDKVLGDAKGNFVDIISGKTGDYLVFQDQLPVRLDQIITINGRPGPAYEEYEAYANACLSCQAGYD